MKVLNEEFDHGTRKLPPLLSSIRDVSTLHIVITHHLSYVTLSVETSLMLEVHKAGFCREGHICCQCNIRKSLHSDCDNSLAFHDKPFSKKKVIISAHMPVTCSVFNPGKSFSNIIFLNQLIYTK